VTPPTIRAADGLVGDGVPTSRRLPNTRDVEDAVPYEYGYTGISAFVAHPIKK
jgi:hypothetical protein